ncbi:MAG: TetR/AcrR family transcriptional regulator [Hyphomicrobium sp.]|jgi:AcrR family transcriptional regulator|uniref:TetR/AcrR family transcriptional regulator n=1 Tax=Hyphomicrobium sp. TaxID=82 RepID=UPI0025B9E715|nr:TetR/AcrR family transcriptional regulator [Hyphomicrobium sp.]MBX9861441.1 TetR/AcrR family transcriptional regulator [Hyphomicrobium sp.]
MTTKAAPKEAKQRGASQKGAQQKAAGQKEGLLRRQEILSAALKLFSERDYSAITIKDIAQLAQVNTSLLYYYYADKEALFRAALEEAVGAAMRNYAEIASKHSEPVDLIDDWFQMHVELTSDIRRLVKILIDYSSSSSQTRVLDDVVSKFYDVETEVLSKAIRRGQRLGLFNNVSPQTAAMFASMHLDGVMVRSIIQPQLNVPAAIAAFRTAFWAYVGYDPKKA